MGFTARPPSVGVHGTGPVQPVAAVAPGAGEEAVGEFHQGASSRARRRARPRRPLGGEGKLLPPKRRTRPDGDRRRSLRRTRQPRPRRRTGSPRPSRCSAGGGPSPRRNPGLLALEDGGQARHRGVARRVAVQVVEFLELVGLHENDRSGAWRRGTSSSRKARDHMPVAGSV